MELHGYYRSSASWRVRIALNLKGLPATHLTHHLRKGEQRDPSYLRLNPQGLVRFHPLLNKWIDQDLLDQVTSQPGQAIWYSLRRQQDSTALIDVLYAIIPYPSATLCGATMQHFTLSSNLQLANDNGQVVPDSAGYFPKGVYKAPACLFTPDKKAFWVYPLRTRLLRPGSRSWQAVP